MSARMVFSPHTLDAFVARVDSLGGPGHPRVDAYWADFAYEPGVKVDTNLDPFGPAYLHAQIALYKEISGRQLDQTVNEHTVFNKPLHAASRNPYGPGNPTILAGQLVQLTTALRLAKPRPGARLLDMGCGWGLSSEMAAYLGLKVHAVDINPDFVDLVRTRSERYQYGITVTQASFDEFAAPDDYDIIQFYECLHHAVEPWSLLERMAGLLAPGGKIIACGEPINAHWWPHWGLRLDPMSVYCIRKHGWFESGWSQAFIVRCLDRALLNTFVHADPDPAIGTFLVASKDERLSAAWMHRNCQVTGAELDGDYLVAGEMTTLVLDGPLAAGPSRLVIHSFRARSVHIRWRLSGGPIHSLQIEPGETRIELPRCAPRSELQIEAETWVPAQEIGNLDTRQLAFQIAGIEPDRPTRTAGDRIP